MLENADDLAIVEGVVGLAKAFSAKSFQGCGNHHAWHSVLKLGCELAQGYGIARPMPASDIPELASSWQADDSWRTVDD
jgi:EAL domain-containing protein (putative c-di-GMP-specific phosphodiesterase class I)